MCTMGVRHKLALWRVGLCSLAVSVEESKFSESTVVAAFELRRRHPYGLAQAAVVLAYGQPMTPLSFSFGGGLCWNPEPLKGSPLIAPLTPWMSREWRRFL